MVSFSPMSCQTNLLALVRITLLRTLLFGRVREVIADIDNRTDQSSHVLIRLLQKAISAHGATVMHAALEGIANAEPLDVNMTLGALEIYGSLCVNHGEPYCNVLYF